MDQDDAHWLALAIVQAQPGIEARSPGAALAAIFAAQLKHYTLAPEFVVGLTRFAGQPVYARRVQTPDPDGDRHFRARGQRRDSRHRVRELPE